MDPSGLRPCEPGNYSAECGYGGFGGWGGGFDMNAPRGSSGRAIIIGAEPRVIVSGFTWFSDWPQVLFSETSMFAGYSIWNPFFPQTPRAQKDPDINAVNGALGCSSTAASIGQYSNVNGAGTAWKGANGNWYRMGWGGNQYTGARSGAVARSSAFGVLSRATGTIGAGFSFFKVVRHSVKGTTTERHVVSGMLDLDLSERLGDLGVQWCQAGGLAITWFAIRFQIWTSLCATLTVIENDTQPLL